MAAGKMETVVLRARRKDVFSDGPPLDGLVFGLSPVAAPTSVRDIRGFAESLDVSVDEVTPDEEARLADEDDVLATLPNMPFVLPLSIPGTETGTPPSISWGIQAIGAESAAADAGRDIVVAVLDTGIKPDHEAFSGMELVSRNFTEDVAQDTDGHGTHTAATIFGRDIDGTRIGVARGVRKALIGKVLGVGGGSTETIFKAMNWALANDAQIINMSLGLDFPGFQQRLVAAGREPRQATSIALAGYRKNIRVFDRLSSLLSMDETSFGGAVVVSASGNESRRPDYSIAVAPPAAGERFTAVGAVDAQGRVADFSNTEVDLVGPGVNIWSAALDGGLRLDSGTSMAAPHVAGVATLLAEALAAKGQVNAREIQRRLVQTAKPLPHQHRRDVGAGLIQAAALF